MDRIRAFARKHKLFVIEDNAEAFGGVYRGKKTGTLGDIAGCSFSQGNAFGRSGFPFKSREYTNPASVDYSHVEVPNALWHQTHTFTCFAYPTYEPHHCEQIGDALKKVIRAYAK